MRNVMRRVILIVLLTGAGASWAEVWVHVGKSEKYTAYIDPSTIRREGDIAKAWDMFDYQAPQTGVGGKRYWSVKRQLEYNCKQGQARALAVTSHAEHEAKGEVIAASSVSDKWKEVPKGSTDELLWRYVCTTGR